MCEMDFGIHKMDQLGILWLNLDCIEIISLPAFGLFSVGLVYCSRDLQVQISANLILKLGLTVLFTHFKIISLQYF